MEMTMWLATFKRAFVLLDVFVPGRSRIKTIVIMWATVLGASE